VPALPVLPSSPPDSRWTRHRPTARPTEAARRPGRPLVRRWE